MILGLCGIQVLKVTYMSCLSKVFETLTHKIHSFRGFKNFRRFRVFVLSYRDNSKEPAFSDMFFVTFRRFWRFQPFSFNQSVNFIVLNLIQKVV